MSVPVESLKTLSKIKRTYGFKYLINPTVQEKIFDKLNLESVYKNPTDLKVLDMYPGPAQHSSIFYNRFKPKQHVLLESRIDFKSYIKETFTGPEFTLYDKDPYEWSTYTNLIDKEKILVPETQTPDHIHDKFLIMAHLTNSSSEALMMQWLACIGNKNWLQRFGLVKMLIWIPTATACKLLSLPNDALRAKCSVVTEAFTNTKLIALSDQKALSLYNPKVIEQCDPFVFSNEDTHFSRFSSISLLEIDPKPHNIDLDNWDYVTKHLMVLRRTPLDEAVMSLGHGAREHFEKSVGDKAFLKKCPVELTCDEFVYLTDIFHKWPFKPDIYMDFVDVYQENGNI